ncbi:hypothetical protein [Cryptosporangium arvum]|uniref:Uncharacterized protein n=1 Tax=Cryptosporangium arvum DSM 44712 TaxID=927661 RepID=A0A010ZMW2_9ACTN|nr:hypothetical protein [Cryptosporangium arvum]EXG80024.1 hypothetical protein CryarDRAFT_1083 [Cryptosporangium arvum DSM 44712]
MSIRFSLDTADRAHFGGPEWLTLDVEQLAGAPAFELEAIEKELGHPIRLVIGALEGQASALGLRALIWLAYRQAGLRTPFGEFNIHTLKARSETVPDVQEAAAAAPLDGSPGGSATSASASS